MKLVRKFLCCMLIFAFGLGCTGVMALGTSAKSAILFEPVSRRTVFAYNEKEKLPMASTTKIVTAITAIENGNLNDMVTTSKRAASVEGSSIWLAEGEQQKLEDLLYGLMLSSGNDAAIAIAEHIGGYDNFVKLMNITAEKAGALNSNFENPNGLDSENHYTTAEDLAKITAYAMKNNTFRKIVSSKEKSVPWQGHEWNRKLKNHNKLLRMYEGCIGVKTGFTKKDGRCLVSAAERNGVTLICVTLNDPNDWDDHINMLNYGFDIFEASKVVEKNSSISVPVANGIKKNVRCMPEKDYILPTMKDDRVTVKPKFKNDFSAPILTGDVVGYLTVYLNEVPIEDIKIISEEDVVEERDDSLKSKFLSIIKYFFK